MQSDGQRHGRVWVFVGALTLLVAGCANASSNKPSAEATVPSRGPATTVDAAQLKTNVPVHAPGVTSSEIKVAAITSKTNNPVGSFGPFVDGVNAYFRMVNDNGGIYGRKLVVSADRDDQFGLNRQTVQQSLAQDNAFATFVATALFTGADLLAQTQQPVFMWNQNPNFAGHPTFYANFPAICFTCGSQYLPYAAKQLHATKVGILAYGIAQQSKDCAQGYKKSFEKYPTAQVAFFDDSLGYEQPVGPQVTQMKQKGVTLILTCVDLQESYTIGKEMQKQGMNAVQQLPYGYNADFMAKNASVMEGDLVSVQFTALENKPRIPEIQKLYKYASEIGVPVGELTAYGWQVADELYTGLAAAGPNFSQAKVVAALNSMTAYDDHGFIEPINWRTGHIDPQTHPEALDPKVCNTWVQVRNGKFVPVYGRPGKPWVCFNRSDPTADHPQFLSFARP